MVATLVSTLSIPSTHESRGDGDEKLRVGIAGPLLGLAIALVAVPAGMAKDGDIRVRGTCTKSSASKLKLSEEDGRIEVEFEVDQNRNGVRWNVLISQNGKQLVRTTRVTKAPSGSFGVRMLAPNRSGKSTFRARATSPSGELHRASLLLRP